MPPRSSRRWTDKSQVREGLKEFEGQSDGQAPGGSPGAFAGSSFGFGQPAIELVGECLPLSRSKVGRSTHNQPLAAKSV